MFRCAARMCESRCGLSGHFRPLLEFTITWVHALRELRQCSPKDHYMKSDARVFGEQANRTVEWKLRVPTTRTSATPSHAVRNMLFLLVQMLVPIHFTCCCFATVSASRDRVPLLCTPRITIRPGQFGGLKRAAGLGERGKAREPPRRRNTAS